MADELLAYYHRELVYLTRLGAEFAERHPAAAGRLRMSADAVEDPHVSRLLQGVAFLNARIRHKLDDEFPELTDALLGVLYPHYLEPIPSVSMVAFAPARDLTEGRVIPAGCEIDSEPVAGERCRFRTTQAAQIWPLEIESATLTGRPVVGPASPRAAIAVLRLTLRGSSPAVKIGQLAPGALRFYLRGPESEAMRLYELIFNNAAGAAIAFGSSDPQALVLDSANIQPVGFERDQGLLPYTARSAPGYGLLTDYFVFPEKYRFFEITGLAPKLKGTASNKFEIYLYLNRSANELERNISADAFALGCTPVVNLFQQRAEPISLTQLTSEYPVVGDFRRPSALEVYSVDRVNVTLRSGEVQSYAPFFGLTHAGARDDARFWHTARRTSPARDTGADTYISFVNPDGEPAAPDDAVASLETTCFNSDLAAKLPFGGGRPRLNFVQKVPGIAEIRCLTAPTPVVRMPSRNQGAWRLISHLALNHLSLVDQSGGAESLREILRLYDFRDAPETRALIDCVVSVSAVRGTARAPDAAMGALCRGLDVTITFDEERTSGSGVFLLAAVLERFIAHYASINSFTRLTALLKGRTGVLRTWPPRAGDLTLI
jgi:type VI secretion system protein ImpG